MITAHQLYNYITDHASAYGMKPLRMSKSAVTTDNKKGTPDLHEYALVALWNRYTHLSQLTESVLLCELLSSQPSSLPALVLALTRIWRACITMTTLMCPWWCVIMLLHLRSSQTERGIY